LCRKGRDTSRSSPRFFAARRAIARNDKRSAPPSNFPVNFRKYLVLAGVTVFAAAGDSMLSHGMKQTGNISLNHLQGVIFAILNPWVAIGILLLLAFFATYMTALSWADLTYVLPATSLGYVLLALVAKFLLHEHISPLRWLGIALITGGVGFIAGGPALTQHHDATELVSEPCGAAATPSFDSAQDKLVAETARNGAPSRVKS
jgi:drug/metabolite transporter (DMT)-like permease